MSRVILNLSIGADAAWFHKGRIRLLKSLFNNETNCEIRYFCNSRYRTELRTPYEDKLSFIKEAKRYGFTRLLWLDCSIQAVRPLDDIWRHIDQSGYYLYETGYNCAQSCNDNALEFYGVTRKEAANIPEVATNVVGINLHHPLGREFFHNWVKSLNSNANIGEKWPNDTQRLKEGQPPFLHHRQDQSTASLAAKGMKIHPHNHFVYRQEWREEMNKSVIFTLHGGF